jgi:hypothetical protein
VGRRQGCIGWAPPRKAFPKSLANRTHHGHTGIDAIDPSRTSADRGPFRAPWLSMPALWSIRIEIFGEPDSDLVAALAGPAADCSRMSKLLGTAATATAIPAWQTRRAGCRAGYASRG